MSMISEMLSYPFVVRAPGGRHPGVSYAVRPSGGKAWVLKRYSMIGTDSPYFLAHSLLLVAAGAPLKVSIPAGDGGSVFPLLRITESMEKSK